MLIILFINIYTTLSRDIAMGYYLYRLYLIEKTDKFMK